MNGLNIAKLSLDNLDSFGDLLHSNLNKNNSELLNITKEDIDKDETWTAVKKAVSDLFIKLGIISDPDLFKLPEMSNKVNLRVGDIITPKSGKRLYLITGVILNVPRTFPSLIAEDKEFFTTVYSTPFKVLRPSLGNIKQEAYNKFVTAGVKEIIQTADTDASSFQPSYFGSDSTHLQIGDLVFGVDPVQISFTTQNGYQIFPTVRSDGNPKLSTGQQIKNISISLIFPNVDAINYQLIPLYAMFRRTPFVNIRNREITQFFSEIMSNDKSDWVPVALESINIQSIEGFPNSVQATVSFLPFDPRVLGNSGLKALLSVNDVVEQQAEINRDVDQENLKRLQAFKLGDSTIDSARLEDMVIKELRSSEDFRESLPFRTFYQALLKDRTCVKNEDGSDAALIGKDTVKTAAGNAPFFNQLRPIHSDNLLGSYSPEDNNSKLSFTYYYIPKDYKEIAREVRENRSELLKERIELIRSYIGTIQNPKDLANMFIPFFVNVNDVIKEKIYEFKEIENAVRDSFISKGWDIKDDNDQYKSTNFIVQTLLHNFGIAPAIATYKDIQAFSDVEKREKISTPIENLVFGGTLVVPVPNVGEADYKNEGMLEHFTRIYNYVKGNSKRQEEFALICENIASRLADPLAGFKNDTLYTTAVRDTGDATGFTVERLPITAEKIIIDNRYDVITSWNVTFSNKFVPFYLQVNKYPFYQHLGFEDATLSLRVVSVPKPKSNKFNLKAALSKMSDRLADTTKVVTFNSPELSMFMDPRIRIDSKSNSIFNALGIKYAVLNSSNSTNRQGQPDSWNTVINLTQAKFTLNQYHSIESVRNLADVEDLLMGLVLRLKKDDDGEFVIRKYYGEKGTEPSLQVLSLLSWLDSDAGKAFHEYVNALKVYQNPTMKVVKDGWILKLAPGEPESSITGGSLKEKIETESTKALKELGFDITENNSIATTELRVILKNNPQLKQILDLIYINYNKLLAIQTQTFCNFIAYRKPKLYSLVERFKDAFSVTGDITLTILIPAAIVGIIAAIAGIVLVGPEAVITSFIVGAVAKTSLVLAGAGVVGGGLITAVDVAKDSIAQDFKDQLGIMFLQLAESVKKDLLYDLAHKINKDPLVKKLLLTDKVIYGDRSDQIVTSKLNNINTNPVSNDFNCYQDFDMNPVAVLFDKSRQIRVAPDFYLHVNNIHSTFIKDYIKDGFDTILRIGQLSMELSLLTGVDVITRFDNLIKHIKTGELNATITQETLDSISNEIEYKTDLNTSLQERVSDYVSLVLRGTEANLSGSALFTKEQQQTMLNQVDELYTQRAISPEGIGREKVDPQEVAEVKKILRQAFIGERGVFLNRAAVKYNFVVAQRDLVLIELMEIFYSIGEYLDSTEAFSGDELSIPYLKSTFKLLEKIRGKNLESKNLKSETSGSITRLKTAVKTVLTYFKDINTKFFNSPSNAALPGYDTIHSALYKKTGGLAHDPLPKADISIPEIRILENMIFNKIGYFIRLNSAVRDANLEAGSIEIDLDNLPELAFLDYFNRREFESSFRKLSLMKDFEESIANQGILSSKLFPTFKIMFVEEDGRTSQVDDFYAFNAIQSIEIVKNKNFASSTAVVRLSNLTGSITDQLSLLRETGDFMDANRRLANNNSFFGTLNVKPGGKILIKVGYGTSDIHLKTIFSGRIVEMNVGPITEIICQSFGAQLRNELFAENFGFWSGVKEHGDIASALLDKIPGLEGFGTKELFSIIGTTGGKSFKNINRNIFDRYLLSNVLSRLDGKMFVTDNPRDENIYLPYDLNPIIRWDPKFTWKVYKQSVWEALQELCLYNINTDVVIRSYNNDSISSRSEQRETVVIGKKSGYYKFTDAYSLSSLDYADIDVRLKKFEEIKVIFRDKNDINQLTFVSPLNPKYNIYSNAVVPNDEKIKLLPKYKPIWDFFKDKTNYVIVSKYLLDRVDQTIESGAKLLQETWYSVKSRVGLDSGLTPEEKFVNRAALFLGLSAGFGGDPTKGDLSSNGKLLRSFDDLLARAKDLDSTVWDEMSKDSFYDVRVVNDNNDPILVVDPRYKRIQKHHFASDSLNLLNNNILLNSNFANTVNLYYFDDPKMADEDGLQPKELQKLNTWSVKAFRDIKDEALRPLNSYQKNIDTTWVDLVKTETALQNAGTPGGYGRIKADDKKGIAQDLQKVLGVDYLNLDQPDWRAFPSFVVVGLNLLKKEIEKMYRGTIELIGDPNIEPMDLLHIEDLLNEVNGVVEIEEVVHSFTPDRGFTTTVTPCLITYDRDPRQIEDESIVNKMFTDASNNRRFNIGKFFVGGSAVLLAGAACFTPIGPLAGITTGLMAAPFAFSGLNGMTTGYHRFLSDAMIEVMGGDCVNFTALVRKGMPMMCGFDGVDYTDLRTIINHKAQNVKGFINRISVFSDPYAAWLTTGFDPNKFGVTQALINKLPMLKQFWTLKNNGLTQESIGFFDVVFGKYNLAELIK